MAKLTTHTLNGLDGTHAGGIAVTLTELRTGTVLLQAVTDDGGRLSAEIPSDQIDVSATYELVFETGVYWQDKGVTKSGVIPEIALRFAMLDSAGDYHMPVIISPYAYSTWKSSL